MTPTQLRATNIDESLEVQDRLTIELALATAERDETRLIEIIDLFVGMNEASQTAAFEVVLQTHLFAGFPKTISALRLMQKRGLVSAEGIDHLRDTEEITTDGEALCAQIYGQSYEPLRAMMSSLHPDFDRWMVMTGYGRVLSRPGLDARLRELAVLPVLAAQGAWPQLQSHAAGAIRCGATADEVWATMASWALRASDTDVESAVKHTEKALSRV